MRIRRRSVWNGDRRDKVSKASPRLYTNAGPHFYIIDKLDYLKHTLRRRRLQSHSRERMGRLVSLKNNSQELLIYLLKISSEQVPFALRTYPSAFSSPFIELIIPSSSKPSYNSHLLFTHFWFSSKFNSYISINTNHVQNIIAAGA